MGALAAEEPRSLMIQSCSQTQVQLVEEIFERIASDLSMIADRELVIQSVVTELLEQRPAGVGKTHISVRLGMKFGETVHHGALLLPLPDAIALACCLMMMPEEAVTERRAQQGLDETLKDAVMEVGNFVCGAAVSAFRALGIDGYRVRMEGCQGVRADVRPRLEYREGDSLVVGRARVALAGYPADEMILMLPEAVVQEA